MNKGSINLRESGAFWEGAPASSSPRFGPLVIGGIGGSGTRVFADIAEGMGFYLGDDLNGAKDNLQFTLLFKQPRWLDAHWDDDAAIDSRLDMLAKLIAGGAPLTRRERRIYVRSLLAMARHGHNRDGAGSGIKFPVRRLRGFLARDSRAAAFPNWGWKEPNSHLFLDRIFQHFPQARYIHVLRDGLDMAFSGNQEQRQNWASFMEMADGEVAGPAASLRFWVRANRRAVELGNAAGNERFLALRLEDLCAQPGPVIDRIAAFLDVTISGVRRAELCALPKLPRSAGRAAGFDLSGFADDDLDELGRLGYAQSREAAVRRRAEAAAG